MKLHVNRVFVNVILIIIACGLLWYVIQTQNLLPQNNGEGGSPDSKNIEIAFSAKNYTLKYDKLDPLLVEDISLFTEEEKWLGSGFIDNEIYSEYPSSLSLSGSDRNEITATRNINFNLSKIIDFDLVLYLKSNPEDLELVSMDFYDASGGQASFLLTGLAKGWQAITIPKQQFVYKSGFNWEKISKLEFNILPRLRRKVTINLGSLRAQPGSLLYNDWNLKDNKLMVLSKKNNEINLLGRSIGSPVATIKKITSVSNFTYKSTYSPLNTGFSGLFFRGNYQTGKGYYLMLGGTNSSEWQLYKVNDKGMKVLSKGEIRNFKFQNNEKYYLKIETKGNRISAYFSIDAVKYTLLADVNDTDFLSGGVGIAIGSSAAALFNDFELTQ